MANPNRTLELLLEAQNNTTDALKQLTKDLNGVKDGMKKTAKQVKDTNGTFKNFTNTIKKQSINLLKYFLIYRSGTAALFAFTGAMKEGINSFLALDKALGEVNTIMGGFQGGLEEVRSTVTGISKAVGIDAVDATNGFYQVLSAGFKGDNPLKIMSVAAKASVAGITDMENSVKALTTTMNVFNLTSQDSDSISDTLFRSVELGVFRYKDLADALGIAGQTAQNVGVEFEELMASMVTVSKTTGGARVAATQLRSIYTALINPSKEMNRIFRSLGVTTGKELIEKFGGFQNAMEAVRLGAAKYDMQLFKVLRRKEALNGFLALTGDNFDRTATDAERLADSTDAASRAFEKMAKTTAHQVNVMGKKIDDFNRHMGHVFVKEALRSLSTFQKFLQEHFNFDTSLSTMKDTGRRIIEFFDLVFISIPGQVLKIFSGIVKNFAIGFEGIGTSIANFFKGDFSFDALKNAFKTIKKTTSDIGKDVVESLKKDFEEAFLDLPDAAKKGLIKTEKEVTTASKKVKTAFENAFNFTGTGGGGGVDPSARILKQMERLGTAMRRKLERSLVMDKELGPKFAAQVNAIIRGSATAVGEAKDDLTPAGLEKLKERLFELTTAYMRLRRDHKENMKDTKIVVEEVNTHFQDMASAVSDLTSGFESINDVLFKMELISERTRDKISAVLSVAVTAAQTIAKIVSLQEKQKGAFQIGSAAFSGGASIVSTLLSAFMHSGGPIQKLHRGGAPNSLASDEVPIIAQTGEYMFSRRAVNNLGGQEAVSRMHQQAEAGKGASSPNVNLNLSFDPDNFRSFLSDTAQGRDIVKQAVIQAFPT